MRFDQKTIIVTGAAAGIGLEAALRFATEGGQVIATDRDAAALQRGVERMPDRITAHGLDVTDSAGVGSLLECIDRVDILFNCAGVVASGALLETTRAEWDRSFLVNVTGSFLMAQAVLPKMLARKRGAILNMASVVSSLKGLPNRCAYGASKAAVIGLTKSIASDYVMQGIRCNAICPGTVDTPSLRQRLHDTGNFESAMTAFMARQPLGRLASADEIAELVLYLGSDAAEFITGQAIAIDGGITI